MIQINALEFRRKFGKIIDRVAKKHESIIIARGDKPLVVITPYDQYALALQQEERKKRLAKAKEEFERWRKENADALKGGIDGMDSTAFIRKVRDSHYGADGKRWDPDS